MVYVSWSPTGKRLVAHVTEVPSRDYQTVLRGEDLLRNNAMNCLVWYDLGKPSGKVVIRTTNVATRFSNLKWRGDGQMAFALEHSRTANGTRTQLRSVTADGVVHSWDLQGSSHQIDIDRLSNLVVVSAVATAGGSQSTTLLAIDRNMHLVPVAAPDGYTIPHNYLPQRGDGLYVLLHDSQGRPNNAQGTYVGRINPETLTIDRVSNTDDLIFAPGDDSQIAFAPRPAMDGTQNLIAFRNQPSGATNRKDPWSGTVMQVAGEAELFWESPSDSAIAYSSQGLLMVREIVKCDKRIYEAALDALVRREQMVQAKSIGAAFHMFAADNEDALPGSLDDLMPYLKNKQVLEGFVFTAIHTKIGDKPPSTTEIGYIAGNGGRVVLYGDGHVKWQPDK
ncbi:MAG: hypothetical protein HONBIEJF_02746 [Fimbriimonadaceae bacterium]|nr:hypothetical protein [Fimbriimonadaceae bacterium]